MGLTLSTPGLVVCYPHLHPILALSADDVSILTTGDWGLPWDGQAHGAHDRLLQLPQEGLRLGPLQLELGLPLVQAGLQTPELQLTLVTGPGPGAGAVRGARLIVTRHRDRQRGVAGPLGHQVVIIILDLKNLGYEL